MIRSSFQDVDKEQKLKILHKNYLFIIHTYKYLMLHYKTRYMYDIFLSKLD